MTHTHLLTPPAFAVTLPSGFSFDMMSVPGGTFMMGGEKHDNEKPVHRVTLSPFYMGRYPVTQALYEAVLGLRPSYFSGPDRPVEQVSWFEAAVFCNKLSDMLGRTPCYYADAEYRTVYGKTAEFYILTNEGDVYCNPKAEGFRLPTEAEWEYAARGGQARQRYEYAGGNRLESVGWYDKNSHGETKPVGLKYPNELGLYDMSGNVWEWCEDWYDRAFYQYCMDKGLELDPVNLIKNSSLPYRVVRGGSWFNGAVCCRAAYRFNYWPDNRSNFCGFRLVLSASEF